jgi:hypothetical protein
MHDGQLQYSMTSRSLVHNHPLQSKVELANNIDSRRNITPAISAQVREMINSGLRGQEPQRRFLQSVHGVSIDRDVFRNLVSRHKRELGMVDSAKDFVQLLEWLQLQIANTSAYARYHVSSDDGYEVDAVFYMSADMIYHLSRNGTVLVMDTTFKTNRFHWPLLIVCGINEHWQTIVFAIALVHHQTTTTFTWALQQMQLAVGPEKLAAVTCVVTDGDSAMSAAITELLPQALHLRCIWHLEQNLRSNLNNVVADLDEFIKQWNDVVAQEDEQGFHSAKAALHMQFGAACAYLDQWHWKNERHFVECYVKNFTTLGIRSTQRVEGMNSVLKGMFAVSSTTALTVLFRTMDYATSEADRRAQKLAVKIAVSFQQKVKQRTIVSELHPHLTYYAASKVKEQFDLQHNYILQQKTTAGVDSVWYAVDRREAGLELVEQRPPSVLIRWATGGCDITCRRLIRSRQRGLQRCRCHLRLLRTCLPSSKLLRCQLGTRGTVS